MRLRKVKADVTGGDAQCWANGVACHFRGVVTSCYSIIDKRTGKRILDICYSEKVIFVKEMECAICGNCIYLLEGA